ncbi:unnamed protein product, partial [Meganyctiphanes norvegica]
GTLPSDGMRAPSKRSEITREWLEHILTQYENQTHPGTKVVIKGFKLQDGMQSGEGYQSQMFKADIEAIVSRPPDGDNPAQEESQYQLIIKLLSSDPVDHLLAKTMRMTKREFEMYSEVIKDLNAFQEINGNDQFRLKLPKLIYGKCINDEFVLVMENVKVNGFKNVSVNNGLNLQQMLCAIEDLAKFHAVSYAYNQKHKFLDIYPCYKVDNTTSWIFTWHNTLFLDTVITYIKDKSEFKDISEKLENIKDELFIKYKEEVQLASNSQVTCLTHGDFWTNNILFKNVENNKNKDMWNAHIIDWQLANWNSPLLDLHNVLQTSTSKEFRKTHLEDVLQFYHSTFHDAVTVMGASLDRWTYEEFKKEYDSYMLYGLFRGLMIVQFVLSDFMKIIKPVNIQKADSNPYLEKIGRKWTKYLVLKRINPDNEREMYLSNSLWTKYLVQEMIEGKNQEMINWVIGIIMEAEEKGLFENDYSRKVNNDNKSGIKTKQM